LNINLSRTNGSTSVRPVQIAGKWDMNSSHLFLLDAAGRRVSELQIVSRDGSTIDLPQAGLMELVCGSRYDLPNPAVVADGVSIKPVWSKQGDKMTVSVAVSNRGRVKARRVPVALYMGTQSKENLVGVEKVTVSAGSTEEVRWIIDTAALDGERKMIAVVDFENRVDELLENDNITEKMVVVAADWSRWRHKIHVKVSNGQVEQEDVPVSLVVDFGRELRRLGDAGALDADSIRVCEYRDGVVPGAQVPAQFDKARDFDPASNSSGEVAWIIPGKLAPGAEKRFVVFFDSMNGPRKGRQPGRIWNERAQTAVGSAYVAIFSNGCLSGLEARAQSGRTTPFISSLVYSSKETGWVKEEGSKLLGMDVTANGPVRAAVSVRMQLAGDMIYEKVYTFYPKRFDLLFKANKSYGLISRAYYVAEGDYEDSVGNKARVDGKGDGEGVAGKCPNPWYYTVSAPDWAHSCVALGKFSNMTYWDAGSWGGIGLSGGGVDGARMSYVIHPARPAGSFGKFDSDRLLNPPAVKIVE